MAKVKLKGGPEPVIKKMADDAIKAKAAAGKIAAGQNAKPVSGVVTEKVMLKEFIPSNVSAMQGPKAKSKMSSVELIDAGLFTSKDGDLVPTAKYQALKKSGGLGKYGIQ